MILHKIDEAIFMASRGVVMSARAGHIKCDIPVEFAHPRDFLIKTTPGFAALKARLTERIRGEAMQAVEGGGELGRAGHSLERGK